jgi:hypothetical protein
MRIILKFYKTHGFFPDLENPKTFSEKVTWIIFNSPDITPYVDKVRAKQIVAEKIGSQYVIPNLYCGPLLPQVRERTWAMPYVVKLNNGSGGNAFVRSPEEAETLDEKIERFLGYDFGSVACEKYYSAIEPMILVEPFISHGNDLPIDYKFHLFDGKLKFVKIDLDREFEHKRVLVDRNFSPLPVRYGADGDPRLIEKPSNYNEMVMIAEKLAEGHGFIRVDLYSVEGRIYFGEFGFTPAAGLMRFDPVSFDVELGRLWTWPDPFLRDLKQSTGF